MAAMLASRQNETLRTVYQRLNDDGKGKLVALTAIMLKIIIIVYVKLRDHKFAKTCVCVRYLS